MNPRKRFQKLLFKANSACREKDFETADKLFREYLEHAPNDPKALFNMGAIRQAAAHSEGNPSRIHVLRAEAMEFYSRVIDSPEVDSETKAHAFNNVGLIMGKIGYPDKAKIAFHFALQLHPEMLGVRNNFAEVLLHEGEYEEADRQFLEIINSDPNGASAQFNRSLILLTLGEIRRGFRDYRSRFAVQSCQSKIMQTDRPMWEGEDINGKTLIVTLEQGFGDQIQFIRYAELIKQLYPRSRVFFSCADCVHALFTGVSGLDGCLPDHLTDEFKAACPEFDYHIPLLHLPDIFTTDLETIPGNVPYIEPTGVWYRLTLEPTDRLKIGIVWAGSPTHGKDRWRSMTTEQFQRFIDAAPNCQFYSLQCGPRAHEVQQLTNCVDLARHITCWTQTADVLMQLDLLISVDTAVAHLAGALSIPVWMLLPSSPDWRWMLGRSDSPWYPTMGLFRQCVKDDWETPITQVIDRLQSFHVEHRTKE
jgi:tetratricopeptide (TPR) repeat protein